MTGPQRGGRDQQPLAPARRVRPRSPESPEFAPSDYDDAEVARGQSAAVLGALGRMQLRLDVLAREQSTALGHIQDALERLEARVAQQKPGTGRFAPDAPDEQLP